MWRQHRWVLDADAAVIRLGLSSARKWQREAIEIADPEHRERVITFAIRLERRDALNNMLALARAMQPIADAGTKWNCDPYLLGVANGVVDLRTGRLRRGKPDDRITFSTSIPFDANAPCRRWTKFVSEIFANDRELVSFVQRAIGYSITGISTEQCLFLLYGTGSNGKGTLVNTLKRLLGDYAWNMPFATIEMRDRAAIPNDVAALVNRRFVTASETNDGTRLNEARVKALTGCDPITARFLHREYFTFEPVAKFWLSVNHKPVVRDDSYGFWRRLRLIPFTQTFNVNQNLAGELAAEGSAILTWAVQGCLAWQREGLNPPACVLQATREYERESDPLAAFIEEACEADLRSEVAARELFEHYRLWAERHGLSTHERLSATMFGIKASERFENARTKTGKVYRGVARRAW